MLKITDWLNIILKSTIAEKNILNLLKDKQQSSKSNNKILPENEKLKGEFNLTENVLNKMKNVDEAKFG